LYKLVQVIKRRFIAKFRGPSLSAEDIQVLTRDLSQCDSTGFKLGWKRQLYSIISQYHMHKCI